jgi:predicted DNA-binding transcriptional regulator AlpA
MSQGRFLRIREIAADLGVSERTINRLHRAGKLPSEGADQHQRHGLARGRH